MKPKVLCRITCLLAVTVSFGAIFILHFYTAKKPPLDIEIFCTEPWMCPPRYTTLGTCELTNSSELVCPDIRTKSNSSLRQQQLAMTRMLRIFDLLANKYNIKYWISYGTLLGAVRHKGFIPWDDDMDIEMRLDPDYVDFFHLAADDLPKDIFFQNSETDPNMNSGEGNDYVLDPRVGYYESTRNPRLRDRNSCYKYCLVHDCKWHDGLQVDIFIDTGTADSEFPLGKMEFEGFQFPVPKNWKQSLTRMYGGNFMKLPPKDERKPKNQADPLRGCEEIAGKNRVETAPTHSTQAPTRERTSEPGNMNLTSTVERSPRLSSSASQVPTRERMTLRNHEGDGNKSETIQ